MKKIFTILVADNNKNVRDFLRRELAAEGYAVDIAGDGRQLLAQLDREDWLDLLLLDLEMPDIDNAEIFEKTRTRQPPLPVIVHTFLTEESERDSSLNKEEVYIEKSGNIDHLKTAIADTLKNSLPRPAS